VRMAREWLTVHAASAEVEEGLRAFHEKRAVDYEGLRRQMIGGVPLPAEDVE
jgi:hypothetical protein